MRHDLFERMEDWLCAGMATDEQKRRKDLDQGFCTVRAVHRHERRSWKSYPLPASTTALGSGHSDHENRKSHSRFSW
jgi:hypothetical protein